MAEEAAAHHLLNVLEERELTVDLDSVLAAFEDEHTKSEAAAWVNDYLNEGTLLTREELELYQSLKKKGLLHHYEDTDDLDSTLRPILDHELSSAIDSLQNSTVAIEEQCKVLEAQRDALMALKALEKPNLAAEHLRNERRRKEIQEKTRLDGSVEDVATSITEQITDAQRGIDNEKSVLQGFLKERLASDDKILTALPNIVSRILTEAEVSDDEKAVDQWCNAIISFRTAEIKARVDAVYLSSLSKGSRNDLPTAPEHELREVKEALQSELETLHSEIASVAEMVVEHELRKPVTEMKDRRDTERLQARRAWLNYVLSTLSFMSARFTTLTTHTETIDEFQRALNHIHTAALQRLPMNPAITEPTMPPTKRHAPSSSKSNAFPIKLKPTKTLDIPPALQEALRHAGVSFNQESISALRDTLVTTQLEREQKLSSKYASAVSSTHNSLAEKMGKAETDARVILDALYTHTPFGTARLVDPEVERELRRVEREAVDAESDLLSAEAEGLSMDDARVRAFVQRYGK